MKFVRYFIPPDGKLANIQIPPFPFDGFCHISIEGSAPFSYQLYSDTGTYYSDKPILCGGKKKLLPFSSYKGMIFCLDFWGIPGTEILLPQPELNTPFKIKYYYFREYTLDGLYRKTPIEIGADKEEEVSLTNYRGGHYEIQRIYSTLNKKLSCKIKYHNKIIERFSLEDEHSFMKPYWMLNWPDTATLYIKNESNSDLEIKPTDIYFAGYLIKPTKVIKKVVPIDARYSSLLEGIKLR